MEELGFIEEWLLNTLDNDGLALIMVPELCFAHHDGCLDALGHTSRSIPGTIIKVYRTKTNDDKGSLSYGSSFENI